MLRLEDIQDIFEERVFARGLDYAHKGRVTNLQVAGNNVSATVIGTKSYEVTVNIDNLVMSCTCPAMEGNGECKHVVAVLVAYCGQGNEISVSKTVVQSLAETKPLRRRAQLVEHRVIVHDRLIREQPIGQTISYMKKLFLRIPGYRGPNRDARYTDRLGEIDDQIAYIVPNIIISKENAVALFDFARWLDKKLEQIDDSDGIISGAQQAVLDQVTLYYDREDADLALAVEMFFVKGSFDVGAQLLDTVATTGTNAKLFALIREKLLYALEKGADSVFAGYTSSVLHMVMNGELRTDKAIEVLGRYQKYYSKHPYAFTEVERGLFLEKQFQVLYDLWECVKNGDTFRREQSVYETVLNELKKWEELYRYIKKGLLGYFQLRQYAKLCILAKQLNKQSDIEGVLETLTRTMQGEDLFNFLYSTERYDRLAVALVSYVRNKDVYIGFLSRLDIAERFVARLERSNHKKEANGLAIRLLQEYDVELQNKLSGRYDTLIWLLDFLVVHGEWEVIVKYVSQWSRQYPNRKGMVKLISSVLNTAVKTHG